jgi:hypothetical protein
MHKVFMRTVALTLALAAVSAQARDALDGSRLVVKPYKNDTFETGEYRFGKAELFGYVGDLKDTKKITAVLLRDGAKASDEQKHLIATIAQAQQLDALIDLDGKEQPLVDPKPAAAPADVSVTPASNK